jgi:hypothetical protein
VAEKPTNGGLSQFGRRSPDSQFQDHRAKWLKVSGHSLKYSRLPETAAGDPVRSALRGRLAVEFAKFFPTAMGENWQCRDSNGAL